MFTRWLAASALAALALAAPASSYAQNPGEFQVPGTDSTIKLYGFVRLDATVDFSGRVHDYEDNDWATFLGAVPDDKSAQAKRVKPQAYLTARTSRFGIQTKTPTGLGELAVKLEGDFNGPNGFQSETFTNSVVFRLRQAHATLGGLLVGQTWSTFLDLNAAPDTVDFNGPGTLALVRNPMIRYTLGFGQANLALALENTRGPQFSAIDQRFQTLPDLHANLGWAGGGATVSARAVLQTYNRAILTTDAAGDTVYADTAPKHKEAIGVGLSGSYKLAGDTIVAQFAGGPGIGRYLLNAATVGNVGFDSAGKLKLINVWGAHAGYTHVWSPTLRSNLIGAYTWVQDPKLSGAKTGDSLQKSFTQVFVNTFFGITKNAEVGVEYAWGQWKSFTNGTPELKGTQNRVNAGFQYAFY